MDINSYDNILPNDMKLMSFNFKDSFYESGSKLDFINQYVEDCDFFIFTRTLSI